VCRARARVDSNSQPPRPAIAFDLQRVPLEQFGDQESPVDRLFGVKRRSKTVLVTVLRSRR